MNKIDRSRWKVLDKEVQKENPLNDFKEISSADKGYVVWEQLFLAI